MAINPYDELPYRCLPIEWTAPERLALASRLHGGPAGRLDAYRVLEIGCGDGSNLLPMAWYRRHASFVGIDKAGTQIDVARQRAARLKLTNLRYVQGDVRDAGAALDGQFDYIVAHGVCSWIPRDALQALLALCTARLAPSGLLYLNYNARPGWNIRGMVRDFLLSATPADAGLCTRTQLAQALSERAATGLARADSPYPQLLANEFRFVAKSEASYVAHEFLSPDNNAFWCSEFLQLAGAHGLAQIADADFNYATGREPEGLRASLLENEILGRSLCDTVDLMCYRQLHSPLLAHSSAARTAPLADLSDLNMASALAPSEADDAPRFVHPTGYEVEAKSKSMVHALRKLHNMWPHGLPLRALFDDEPSVRDDLLALHRNGLVDLRIGDVRDQGTSPSALNELESQTHDGAWVTNKYHMRQACARAG